MLRKTLFVVSAVLCAALALFPPFRPSRGSLEHAFIFAPPSGHRIDLALLFGEFLAVVLSAVAVWFVAPALNAGVRYVWRPVLFGKLFRAGFVLFVLCWLAYLIHSAYTNTRRPVSRLEWLPDPTPFPPGSAERFLDAK